MTVLVPTRDEGPDAALTRGQHSGDLGWSLAHAGLYSERPVADPVALAPSPYPRVVLVTRGRYVIHSKQGSGWRHALYGPGSVGATAPGRTSTLRWQPVSPELMESLHIHLDARLVTDTAHELRLAPQHPDFLQHDDAQLGAACAALGWGLRNAAPALYADAAAQVLAVHLLGSGRVPARTDQGGLSAASLTRVVAYLHDHLQSDVTLDELSAVAHLSKYHFLRQFSVSVGQTPHRYLTSLRLERASELLRTTDRPVHSVATACGYASASRFGAAFARRFGETPGRHRASARR